MSRHASILLIASALAFFLGLGRGAIGDSDEAFYAEAAREMTESGDWLTPRYNYELRFQKPILYYWLAAAAYEVAGVNAEAARAPAALSGLGLVVVTWLLARRRYSPDVGLLAGLIVATNFGYFTMARMALPDLPLAFFITVATWAILESIDAGRAGDSRGAHLWLLLTAAAAALGVLTKGPVAVALPGLVGIGWLIARRGGKAWPWTVGHLALAALLFVAIAAPWYLAMAREHGLGYLHRFFIGENLDRFATDRYNDPRPIWFYVPIVAGGLLPWSTFLTPWFGAAARVATRTRTIVAREWQLILWAGIPLAFYSLSIGKQPRYVLPVLPPLAVLLAASLLARVRATDNPGRQRTVAWCTTVSALILLVFGALLHRAKPLLFATDPSTGLVATTVIFAVGFGLLALAWIGRPSWIPLGVAVASTATLLSLHYSVYSAAGLEPVQRMAASLGSSSEDVTACGTYRVFVRNFVFYTGVKQTDLSDLDELAAFLSQPRRVVVVTREEDLDKLELAHGLKPRRLDKVTYFNAAGLRVRTLLDPRPEQDLETVWLVSNQ